ncbi:unnamed protein product [Sphagnum jensenii]|uniref:Siah interacting protein N-terminal domain-containing protein n=1 Tax=Sphagnum jensenii TaxID=128206 RepID=A0ABP0W8Q8_9BRYO
MESRSSSAMAADIVGDIQELRQLLHYAKRPRVQSLLSSHISSLQKICIPLEGAFQEKMVCARLKNQERREERRRNRKQHAEARARLTDQERQ